MGGAVNIVTGTPFTVTFINGTNTFNISGGDFTGMFNVGAILTALGGSPNGGYQQVSSSTYDGIVNITTVTVSSYSTGTSYPGPATFTTGTGTVLWFQAGTPIVSSSTVIFSSGINSSGGPLFGGEMQGYSDGTVSGGPGYTPPYGQGITVGSFTSGTVLGIVPQAIVFEDTGGVYKVEVIVPGTVAQNYFSSMSFTDQTSALETFTTSSATFSQFTSNQNPFTAWQWDAIEHYPFGFGSMTVTFTG